MADFGAILILVGFLLQCFDIFCCFDLVEYSAPPEPGVRRVRASVPGSESRAISAAVAHHLRRS